MPFKTTVNCLFIDIWCYLVIGCFDWKIGVFQQTVVRSLLYRAVGSFFYMVEGGGGRGLRKKTMAETSQSSPPENQFRTKVLMIQNLLFGFFIFFENIISGIQLFYIRSNVHVVIRFFFISDFLAESLNANKTSKKNHSFYNTVSL